MRPFHVRLITCMLLASIISVSLAPSSALAQSTSETYQYSKTGKILYKEGVGAYEYDDPRHPHAPTKAGDTTYTYDANGNRITETRNGQTTTYVYGFENRLIQVTNSSGTTRYVYDPNGNRVQKILPNGKTTTYIADIAEVDETGAYTDYLFLNNRRVATVKNGVPTYNITDHLGSSSLQIDPMGNVVQKIDYMPFGTERVNVKNTSFDASHTFTDQEIDQETGLIYFGARYYDPRIGMFIQQDPVLFMDPRSPEFQEAIYNPQRLNPYSYALNNPIRYNDPDGKRPDEAIAGAAVGFTEALGYKAIWLAQKAAHPIQSVQEAGSMTAQAAKELASIAQNPSLAFLEASQGYSVQAKEFGEWYWNASDYERGKVLGHIAEGIAEGYVIGKVGGKVLKNISKVSVDQNKLVHIFDKPEHNLDFLIKEFGTKEKAFQAIQKATQAMVTKKQITSTFETTVQVGGQKIIVRGKVIDGTVNIGTAFKPSQ